MGQKERPPAEILEVYSQVAEDFRKALLANERWRDSGCAMATGDLSVYPLGGWEGSFFGERAGWRIRVPVFIESMSDDELYFAVDVGHHEAGRVWLENGRIEPADPTLYQKTIEAVASLVASRAR